MNLRKLLMLVFLAVAVCVMSAGVGAAAVITVDDSGGADFTSIQAAVDAASTGDTIEVRSGTYYENVDVGKRLTLIGEGVDVVTVIAESADDNVFTVTADHVTISGFTTEGATGGYWQGETYYRVCGIYILGTNYCNIFNNIAYNNYFGIAIGYSANSNAIIANNASNNSIGICIYSFSNNNDLTDNIAKSNNYYGIWLWHSDNNTLTNNTASDNNYGTYLYSSSNNTFHHNNLIDNINYNAYDIGTNQWDSGSEGNYWGDDYIGTDSDGDGIGDTPYPIPGGSSVDRYPLMNPWGATPSMGPVHNIIKGTDYTTIQAAIDDASPGDEIHVDSGTYYENVNITKQLILQGVDKGDGMPVVDAGGIGNAITLYEDGITLDGFNAINATRYPNAGIKVISSYNTLSGNTASNNSWFGIYLSSSSNNMLSSNMATNHSNGIILSFSCNNILSSNMATNNSNGIFLSFSSNNMLSSNMASNNSNGIWVDSSSNNNILNDNTASNNSDNGILLQSSSNNNTLNGNTASNNSNFGIWMGSSSNNTLSCNIASNNYYGMWVYSSTNNSFSGNVASNNELGIFLASSSNNNTLSSNTASNNSYYGINLEFTSNNLIYHNNLINNTNNAYDRFDSNQWYWGTTGNYYSDYTGTDSDGDGIGDTPYPIPGGSSVDNYPLMEPYSPPTSDYESKLIQQIGDFKVYLIEDSKKRHFTSPEALEWNGHSFDDVIEVSEDVINSFETGEDISITQTIIDKYNALDGAATFGTQAGTGEQSGYPDSSGVVCTYVNFQNGAIEHFTNGNQAGNAYAILNPFFDKWAFMGYAKSVLGYPISDMSDPQTSSFGTPFRYQNFMNGTERGSLEYNLSSGDVFEIHGAIYATWSAMGYANSIIGLVTSDERDAVPSFKGTTGRVSDFENGHLHWHSSGDHYMVTYMTYGDLDKLYVSMGGTASWLGFPVMVQEDRGGYGYCEFEGGYIEWDVASGKYVAKNSEITDGLVAEWHFDEGTGNVLGDSSGNGNDGTIYGATWTTNGKFDSALQFDGNDYIVIPDSPELSGGAGKNLTVEYWFNTNNQGAYIISKIRDVSYKDWSALIGGFGPGLNFWYENRGYDRRFYSGSTIEEGIWHHGAFTFQRSTSGSNAVLKMYLDGNELPLTPFYQDGVPSNQLYDMPDTSAPVSIGYAGTYYGNLYFNGKIDEIRVFDRVLTAEDIKSEFDRGGADNQIVISELLPEHDSHLGSTSVQFSWRTNLESTSDLFIKQQDETSYSHYTGNTGTFHSITADNLLRNTWYNFYVSSGSKDSEVRNIYIDNGIEFTQKSYNFNIERDYSQQATVTVQNTDTKPHNLLVSVNNPYDDLIVGFIGDGSQDQEITLDPGESRDVTLSIFAQDAMLSEYQLQINLNSIDSNINDYAVVNLNVRQPNIDFSVTEIGADPYTLTKTFQVTNNGDRITDFTIFAEDGLEDRVLFKPAIIHANVGSGESLTFKLVPLLESDTPITGFINATGADYYERIAVDFSQSGGKTLFTSILSDVTICMGTNSWYCTNRPNIRNTLSIPPGFESSDVEGAVLAIDFSLPWSESTYRNHNVDISLNGHLLTSLNDIVPNGLYLIPVDPSFLNYGSGGTGVNQIDITTKHLNGGHYVVATNIEFRLKLNQLTTKLFADSQEEADNVVKSLDILCDKCVPKTEIISVEPSPPQLEAIAGQDVTFDVNVNLKNVQDGALEVDVFKGGSLIAKSFRDVTSSPETTETFTISFKAPDNAGSHEYKILTRFREGAIGELIDDSFCDVRLQSSYNVNVKSPTITVTSPNGGEDWEAGTIKPIQWTYTSSPDTEVWIEILKDGWVEFRDLVPIGNNGHGFYEWKIEQSQPYGADYQVRITSYTDSTYTDTSNYFTISKPSTLMSVEITSPNNEDQIIEDIDSTFSSLVSGGVSPYKFEWVDDKGNILSTSQNFNINFYSFYGDDIKIFDPEDIIFIDLIVTDANGAWGSDNTYVYVVPPEPEVVSFDFYQDYEKQESILDKNKPYEIRIKIKNTDDNPHWYSLKLKTIENDAPTNLKWNLNPETIYRQNDLQTKLIQPGSTRIYYYEFKSDWDWIPPKSTSDVILQGMTTKVIKEMSKKIIGAYIGGYFDIIKIIGIYEDYKLATPIVSFTFTPDEISTPTIKGLNIFTPLYVGNDKVNFHSFYLCDKILTMPAFLVKPPYGPIVGIAAYIDSGIQYNKAVDPVFDYEEVFQPEPYNVPEIDSLPDGLYKKAAKETFEMLSYSKAEEISYIRYAGAVEDNAYDYALLQLEAAKNYNDMSLEKIEILNNIYKIITLDDEPLTNEQIEVFNNKIITEGLPTEAVSILNREGLEEEIPRIIQIILNIDPEMYKDSSVILEYNNLNAKLLSTLSNDYIKAITEIKVYQLGESISDATPSHIEEIETMEGKIQLGLNKGYATQELKDNIQSMLDLANALIIQTNNNEYLHYYSFARDAQVKFLTLQMPIDIDYLPPITTMDQYNLKDGSTLPIKFTARDNETGEFIYDDTVNVTISNSTGHLITYFTNGTGTDSVRINSTEEQYIANFHTKDYAINIGETYSVTVTFGEPDSLRGYDITYFTLIEGGMAKGKGN